LWSLAPENLDMLLRCKTHMSSFYYITPDPFLTWWMPHNPLGPLVCITWLMLVP